MTKAHAAGAIFTFGILLSACILLVWRVIVYHRELLDCYKTQVRDAVTLIPTEKP